MTTFSGHAASPNANHDRYPLWAGQQKHSTLLRSSQVLSNYRSKHQPGFRRCRALVGWWAQRSFSSSWQGFKAQTVEGLESSITADMGSNGINPKLKTLTLSQP